MDFKEHTVLMMLPNEIKLAEELHDKLEQRTIKQYKILVGKVLELEIEVHNGIDCMDEPYNDFVYRYLLLVKLLEFTKEQIEKEYLNQNEVNRRRQNNGY